MRIVKKDTKVDIKKYMGELKANRTNRSFTSIENRNIRPEQGNPERRVDQFYENYTRPYQPQCHQPRYNQQGCFNETAFNYSNYTQCDPLSQHSQGFMPNPNPMPQPSYNQMKPLYGQYQAGYSGDPYGINNSFDFSHPKAPYGNDPNGRYLNGSKGTTNSYMNQNNKPEESFESKDKSLMNIQALPQNMFKKKEEAFQTKCSEPSTTKDTNLTITRETIEPQLKTDMIEPCEKTETKVEKKVEKRKYVKAKQKKVEPEKQKLNEGKSELTAFGSPSMVKQQLDDMIEMQKKEMMEEKRKAKICKSIFQDLNRRLEKMMRGIDLEREAEKLKECTVLISKYDFKGDDLKENKKIKALEELQKEVMRKVGLQRI